MAEILPCAGNPASPHRAGRHARELMERSRRVVAERLAVEPDRIVFTSGGTEANNLALLGFPGPHLVSAVEHASVLEAVPDAPRVPVDSRGLLDLAALARMLAERRPRIVSVMLANNETGVIQPVREAARLAHTAGAVFHCDAVQALGKLTFTANDLEADLISLSAHKLGGPPGIGALVLRPALEPLALQRGGGQEGRRRAGTPNLPGIVGFAAALDLAADWPEISRLRDGLERAARERHPGVRVAGADVSRLPNISCLITPGVSGEVQLMGLDLAGVAVGIGAACSSGRIGPSHVLSAMGLPPELSGAAIRVSLGWSNGPADTAAFVAAWAAQVGRSHGRG
jgi:cysteine desulfurase